ncbi:MAG: hypothetical protein HRT63_10250 [Erythrobacter sp.]|nr:hypothetical protein [Erythrobacter sp.]
MNKENTAKLRELFPSLLQQMDLPPSQTCMCWGFEYDDGWYQITHDMLSEIEAVDPEAQLMQAKEKWGRLRVYVDGNIEAREIARNYEDISAEVCEICGSTEDVKPTTGGGWINYLCKECRDD